MRKVVEYMGKATRGTRNRLWRSVRGFIPLALCGSLVLPVAIEYSAPSHASQAALSDYSRAITEYDDANLTRWATRKADFWAARDNRQSIVEKNINLQEIPQSDGTTLWKVTCFPNGDFVRSLYPVGDGVETSNWLTDARCGFAVSRDLQIVDGRVQVDEHGFDDDGYKYDAGKIVTIGGPTGYSGHRSNPSNVIETMATSTNSINTDAIFFAGQPRGGDSTPTTPRAGLVGAPMSVYQHRIFHPTSGTFSSNINDNIYTVDNAGVYPRDEFRQALSFSTFGSAFSPIKGSVVLTFRTKNGDSDWQTSNNKPLVELDNRFVYSGVVAAVGSYQNSIPAYMVVGKGTERYAQNKAVKLTVHEYFKTPGGGLDTIPARSVYISKDKVAGDPLSIDGAMYDSKLPARDVRGGDVLDSKFLIQDIYPFGTKYHLDDLVKSLYYEPEQIPGYNVHVSPFKVQGKDDLSLDVTYTPLKPDGKYELTGDVWQDSNRNGVWDSGEKALAGVEAVLVKDGKDTGKSAVVDKTGKFVFSDLDEGSYTVKLFGIPRDFVYKAVDGKKDLDVPAVKLFDSKSRSLEGAGNHSYNYRLAVYRRGVVPDILVPSPPVNRQRPPARREPAKPVAPKAKPQPVVEQPTSQPLVEPTVQPAPVATVPPQPVHVPQPPVADVFQIPAAGSPDDPHEPDPAKAVSIGGSVYVDSNRNGWRDPGEIGIPNVKVELYRNSKFSGIVTKTDANGDYRFPGLKPGDYNTKFEDIPLAYQFIDANGNESGGTNVDPETGMSYPQNVFRRWKKPNGRDDTVVNVGLVPNLRPAGSASHPGGSLVVQPQPGVHLPSPIQPLVLGVSERAKLPNLTPAHLGTAVSGVKPFTLAHTGANGSLALAGLLMMGLSGLMLLAMRVFRQRVFARDDIGSDATGIVVEYPLPLPVTRKEMRKQREDKRK